MGAPRRATDSLSCPFSSWIGIGSLATLSSVDRSVGCPSVREGTLSEPSNNHPITGSWTPVDPRPLAKWEAETIARLAPEASQEAFAPIRVIDRCECGCRSVGFSQAAHFLVAEADAPDEDGAPISIMLFAGDNETSLATLDVLRMDG